MKLILFLICLGIAGFAGWIAGSLHPAPASLLAMIQQGVSDATQEVEDVLPATADLSGDVESSATSSAASAGADAEGSLDQYRAWMEAARRDHPYPESVDKMYAVMMCESGGRADIVNPAGPYTGLFQYATGTWNDDWNTYRGSGITNARAQIFATALAWNLGMQSHWGCYSRAH